MQEPGAPALSPKAALPRFGAVVAASGPVILTTFGVGRRTVGWFCSSTAPEAGLPTGPYSLVDAFGLRSTALDDLLGELLFWGVLLLPIVVAGLVLNGSRRATLAAVAAIATVLAYGLVIAFLLPASDPCTGREHAVVPPWLLIGCYPMAAGALLLAARSPLPLPLPRGKYGMILWAGAAVAAAWAAMFDRLPATFTMFVEGVAYETEASSWDGFAWWFGDADTLGLPVVIVALAMAAPTRWKRVAGAAAAAALLSFVLVNIVTYLNLRGDAFAMLLSDWVRWRLLLAAVLVTSAAWHPWVRLSWTGTVHLARSLIRGQLKSLIPRRTKDLTVAILIAAGTAWLIVSSFTPTR